MVNGEFFLRKVNGEFYTLENSKLKAQSSKLKTQT